MSSEGGGLRETKVSPELDNTLFGITYPPYWSSTIASRRIGSPPEKSPTLGMLWVRLYRLGPGLRAPADLVTINIFKDYRRGPRFYVPDVVITRAAAL